MGTATMHTTQPLSALDSRQLHAALSASTVSPVLGHADASVVSHAPVSGGFATVCGDSWAQQSVCFESTKGYIRRYDENLVNPKHTPGGRKVRVLT